MQKSAVENVRRPRIAVCESGGLEYSGRVRQAPGKRNGQGTVFAVLWLTFFLHGMVPGFWLPSLTNILNSRGLGAWVPAAFMIPPLCALVAPLIGGALADQRLRAERLFAWSSLASAVALAAAFGALQAGWHPLWFILLLGCYSLCAGPGWSLLATVALTHLTRGELRFPLVRVGATVGWVVAGLLAGYVLGLDASPRAGQWAAGLRLIGGVLAFWLPFTPPLGTAGSWRSRLGCDAFGLLKQRDLGVFFTVTALVSVPLTAFYMYGPEFLWVLGDPHPTGTMAVAQVLEIVSMLVVGMAMARFRLRGLLLWALGLSALRFGLSAVAGIGGGIGWHVAGIALHGVCYTFYFITAQVYLDRRVAPGLRSQAQGLLVMVSSGLGPLLGAAVCGWLRQRWITPDGHGWAGFWLVLAAMIALCWLGFALGYRQKPEDGPATGT